MTRLIMVHLQFKGVSFTKIISIVVSLAVVVDNSCFICGFSLFYIFNIYLICSMENSLIMGK